MFLWNRSISVGAPLLLALSVMLLALVGCGDKDDGGFAERRSGSIQVSPLRVAFSQVNLGASAEETVILRNIADETLIVYELDLLERDGGSIEDLELVEVPSVPFEVAGRESVTFRVRFSPTGDRVSKGKIQFISSDPRYTRENPLIVEIDTFANRPQLEVQPPVVRFTRMPPGQKAEQTITIQNVGSAPLTIFEAPVYTGGNDFSIAVPDRTFPLELDVFDRERAEEDPDAYGLDVVVTYAPGGAGADSGEILIVSNDVREIHPTDQNRGISRVDVQANADAPCILVDGLTRNFGQVPVGGTGMDIVSVSNCGTQTLVIDDIQVTENSPDRSFELDLGDWAGESNTELDQAVTLAAGASGTFRIRYTPAKEGTDRGKVVIYSNDPVQPELGLDLVARGSDGVCPVAEAFATVRGVSSTPRANLSAVPLQYVILDGSSSFDEDGVVVDYEWEVLSKPDGTFVQLGPTQEDSADANAARREFRLMTAGKYEIGLNVVDNDNFRSCNQAVVTITAIPNSKVHIELTWTNPADPDETDNVGSDLDLHFVKMGPGRWFEAPYDIYFRNPNRDSNSDAAGIWNPENPSLDIDVTSGAGPENITMDNPVNCQWYAIGVHYYQEMFGTAYATIRIYINANLVFERLHMPMTRGGQFWDVARIHWDTNHATIFDVDAIAPSPSAGQAPAVTEDMKASGLCTVQDLY